MIPGGSVVEGDKLAFVLGIPFLICPDPQRCANELTQATLVKACFLSSQRIGTQPKNNRTTGNVKNRWVFLAFRQRQGSDLELFNRN